MKAIVKAKAEPGLTVRIRERNVKVAIRFNFHSNHAARVP
jgi:hypothetical protein